MSGAIKISSFDGETPRLNATALPPNGASTTRDAKLYAGSIRPFNGPLYMQAAPVTNCRSIFRLYPPQGSSMSPVFLGWATDVDVAKGQLADTSDGRIYYTGDSFPKKTNYAMATGGAGRPNAWLKMGVAAPTSAPTVVGTNGTSTYYQTLTYVYTYISTFGAIVEESAPSPASAQVTITVDGTVAISNFASPPTSGYNITGLRIYRATTGTSGEVTFLQVAEVDFAAHPLPYTFTDNVPAISLGQPLPSLGWNEPPATMIGIVDMPGGLMAGFAGNTVYFCVPYYHHAWPESYAVSFAANVVGLSVWGQTLVILTDVQPYLLAGTDPTTFSIQNVPLPQPCISKRSIASSEYGSVYASPEGIVQIGYIKQDLVSTKWFRRQDWQALNPASMTALMYDNEYVAFFDGATRASGGLMLDPSDMPNLTFLSITPTAVTVDQANRDFYYVNSVDNAIYQFDGNEMTTVNYIWQSKRFYLGHDTTFSAIKVDADYSNTTVQELYAQALAGIEATNQALITAGQASNPICGSRICQYRIADSQLTPIPNASLTAYVQVQLIDEDNDVQIALTMYSENPQRIPPFRTHSLTMQVTGNIEVTSLAVAPSVRELQ
jgi:hypothetical protein